MSNKQTKAKQVRELIAQAKATDLQPEDIVEAAMAVTGHPRQLTRAYIKNNWDKVENPCDTIAKMCEEFVENLPETVALAMEEMYVDSEDAEQPAPKARRVRKAKAAA